MVRNWSQEINLVTTFVQIYARNDGTSQYHLQRATAYYTQAIDERLARVPQVIVDKQEAMTNEHSAMPRKKLPV